MTVRERVARFIASEGHRVDVVTVAGTPELSELIFRTRGQAYSIVISETEPNRFTLSTAYEVPEPMRDPGQIAALAADLAHEYPQTRFDVREEGRVFVATLEVVTVDSQAFVTEFWATVGQLREAGTSAIARLVDRNESKLAADKFIRQFTKSQR